MVECGAEHARGAAIESGRVDEVWCAPWVHMDGRSQPCEGPAASRVVEVDVREEQVFDLLE